MTLTLMCPALLGPLPQRPPPFPATPTLDRLIGRATAQPSAVLDPLAAVLTACGISTAAAADAPTGALALRGEDGAWNADGYWCHADPVHFRADRDRLLLFAGAHLAPDRAEADALTALFNAHFAEEGLHLLAATPQRWYLRVDPAPALRTTPLAQVQGRTLTPELMTGAAALRWHSLLNEAQMLFFNSEVNQLREQQRRPVISGIWPWGGGTLPVLHQPLPELLVGDHPLLRGLARHGGVAHQTLAQWQATAAPVAECVIYWDHAATALLAQDVAAWTAAVVELDAALIATERQLRATAGTVVVIDPIAGRHFQSSRTQVRRFWHRRRFLAEVNCGEQ
jgi:hypothetical protein